MVARSVPPAAQHAPRPARPNGAHPAHARLWRGSAVRCWARSLLALASLGAAAQVVASIEVVDDEGRVLTLAAPAQRIVSLAPNITELLFAAGAGDRIVGAVAASDYPEAARHLPRVGNHTGINLEAVAALRPDLVIAWSSGYRDTPLDKFAALGIPVFLSESRHLGDIPQSLERFGRLAGTEATAQAAADAFRARHRQLGQNIAQQPVVSVFYQIWHEPLMTIGGPHMISDLIRLCGGRNVFADLPQLAPRVTIEAVLQSAPEVIIASGAGDTPPEGLSRWRAWPALPAVQSGRLHAVPADLIQRPTPRILDGADILCGLLAAARAAADEAPPH